MSDHELTVLGSTVREPIEHVEVFPAPPDLTEVRLTSDEVSSMCPVTSQPDLSSVEITYQPGEWCVETKSLKLYLWGFRDRPLFAEAMAAEIAAEVMSTARPMAVTVRVTQRPRGGIVLAATSAMEREPERAPTPADRRRMRQEHFTRSQSGGASPS
jgi:7-cyano-7-deazaguanine reductase